MLKMILNLNLNFLYATLDTMSTMGIVGVKPTNSKKNIQHIPKPRFTPSQPIPIPRHKTKASNSMQNPYTKPYM
jgi:hypothetical protein